MTVRIQSDRGQEVTSRGPYRYMRHPGYAGSLVYTLLIPRILQSWWMFIPLVTVMLIVVRTRLEDRTLQLELPGYKEYAGTVRYRLIPGFW